MKKIFYVLSLFLIALFAFACDEEKEPTPEELQAQLEATCKENFEKVFLSEEMSATVQVEMKSGGMSQSMDMMSIAITNEKQYVNMMAGEFVFLIDTKADELYFGYLEMMVKTTYSTLATMLEEMSKENNETLPADPETADMVEMVLESLKTFELDVNYYCKNYKFEEKKMTFEFDYKGLVKDLVNYVLTAMSATTGESMTFDQLLEANPDYKALYNQLSVLVIETTFDEKQKVASIAIDLTDFLIFVTGEVEMPTDIGYKMIIKDIVTENVTVPALEDVESYIEITNEEFMQMLMEMFGATTGPSTDLAMYPDYIKEAYEGGYPYTYEELVMELGEAHTHNSAPSSGVDTGYYIWYEGCASEEEAITKFESGETVYALMVLFINGEAVEAQYSSSDQQ